MSPWTYVRWPDEPGDASLHACGSAGLPSPWRPAPSVALWSLQRGDNSYKHKCVIKSKRKCSKVIGSSKDTSRFVKSYIGDITHIDKLKSSRARDVG